MYEIQRDRRSTHCIDSSHGTIRAKEQATNNEVESEAQVGQLQLEQEE